MAMRQLVEPQVAAALFDALGEVEWFVVERATFSALRVRRLELSTAKRLKQTYRGSVARKKHYSNWIVSGRDSELFAESILPHLVDKKNLVELYILYRYNIINSSGRGRASVLDEEALALRQAIADEFAILQGKKHNDEEDIDDEE